MKVWDCFDSLLRGDFEADLRAAQDAVKKANGIILTRLENEMTRINNEHVNLTARRREIEREIQGVELSDDRIESLMQFRDRVLVGLEHATQEEKRQIYKILQMKVLIKNHQVRVSCLIASHTSWSGVRLDYIA